MSFKTVSAILRGRWLIEPTYAKTQLPLVLEMIKGSTGMTSADVYKNRLEHQPKIFLPTKQNIASTKTDVYSVSPYTSTDRLPYNSIAMIDVLGPVLKYGDYCSYGTVEYTDLINRLASSERVKGILINIDSPGGQADGTGMFAEAIRNVSKIKPVLGVVQDGIAASAAMWIGAATQELYVTRATDQVGSIGAYTTLYDFTQYFEDNGVKIHEIYAPQSTDKNKDYKDALKGDYTLIETDLKFLVEDFKKDVSKSRGGRLKTNVEDPFTGKMYLAKDAIKVGLIDGIKPISGVIQRIEELINLRN